MNKLPLLTDEVFLSFMKCKYKAYLKLKGESGEKSGYEQAQAGRLVTYKAAVVNEFRRRMG